MAEVSNEVVEFIQDGARKNDADGIIASAHIKKGKGFGQQVADVFLEEFRSCVIVAEDGEVDMLLEKLREEGFVVACPSAQVLKACCREERDGKAHLDFIKATDRLVRMKPEARELSFFPSTQRLVLSIAGLVLAG